MRPVTPEWKELGRARCRVERWVRIARLSQPTLRPELHGGERGEGREGRGLDEQIMSQKEPRLLWRCAWLAEAFFWQAVQLLQQK